MHQLFGLNHGQFLSSYESFLALLHPEDRERVFNEVAHALEAQLPFDSEYRVIWPDGTLHHIAARARVLMDDKQQPSLMTGTCWDITDKKRLEKMKSEFVATVSHELRTPLSSISAALALLTRGSEKLDAAQRQKLLEVADKNTERLKHLIDDLLDMEKLAQARMQYDFHVCALAPLVQRALDENRFYAEQHAVSFRMDTGLVVAEVRLDPGRFLQIMANLLSNAAKFSEPGTEVVVSLSLNAPGWVRVAVTDQGIGIDEKDQPHIFDKFFQVDSSDQRRKGGTGLGLAIARAMAEQMQGRLGFSSSPGQGSCFYVDFPLFMDFLAADEVTSRAKESPDFSAPSPQPTHD
jgi:signal transduction histidine kinase